MYPSANVHLAKRAWSSILTADMGRLSHLRGECCSRTTPKENIYLRHRPPVRSFRCQVNQGILVEGHSLNNEVNYQLMTAALSSGKPDHGNKGRVPWNKGVKHSEETRSKIRHRTKEALMDPKVRKKMSDAPRSLSDQTRERIRRSVLHLWSKRLKRKRAAERLLRSWAESIALAAKAGGGSDQQELQWDSYEKHQKEMEELKRQAVNNLRTERTPQKRRERAQTKVDRGETGKRNIKAEEEKWKLKEQQEEKLKKRLLKIHMKKSRIDRVSGGRKRNWESFDLPSVEEERLHNEVSLADQIREARSNMGPEGVRAVKQLNQQEN